jgi:hypothetical protein
VKAIKSLSEDGKRVQKREFDAQFIERAPEIMHLKLYIIS